MSGTDFLYPFLADTVIGDTERRSRRAALLDGLGRSAAEKWQLSTAVAAEACRRNADNLALAATLLHSAERILVAGNGGSSCDADRFARLMSNRLAVHSLAADHAIVTALSNDIGFERVFARQVEALGRAGDVLVVWSTSGQSANILAALDEAHRRGLRTIAFGGYRGGRFVDNASVDVALVVDDASVHRIQEAQAALVDELCARVKAMVP